MLLTLHIFSRLQKRLRRTVPLVFVFSALTISACAQVAVERFGQNRVQYKDFVFQYYESDNFTTYFYQGGQDVAKYVIKTAEDVCDEISALLDFKYRRRIDIVVYNNINELNQTNIGIYEPGQNSGGTTKIPDNKIFIYFNGDHRHLDKQIREGIARIYLSKMVMGNSFAEIIQNAVLLNLPDWYRLGLIQYIGEPWSSALEDKLRDGIMSGRYRKLRKLPPDEAVFVGHSIWHYIEERHGKTAVSNIIYLTRINRSVDNGFLFVLGTNLEQTLLDWFNYYYERFTQERTRTQLPSASARVNVKFPKNEELYGVQLSADGKYVAYATNDMGRHRVWLFNTGTGRRNVVFRGGYRTNTQFTDASVPLVAFDPSAKILAILHERRSQIFLRLYDLLSGKTEVHPVRKFQKVLSMRFVDNKQLVLSAVQNGQTDIFLYTIASTTTRKITDDYFDDLQPAYIEADSLRGILFSSNRPDDTLRPGRYESQTLLPTHDLFFYDLNAGGNVLYRITTTPHANESQPLPYSSDEFCFLSDANGICNRYAGHFEKLFDHNEKKYVFFHREYNEIDSVTVRENVPFDSLYDPGTARLLRTETIRVYRTGGVNRPLSNYAYNIREHATSPGRETTLDLLRQENKPVLYKSSYASASSAVNLPVTESVARREMAGRSADTLNKKQTKPTDETNIITDSSATTPGNRPFDFQSEFDFGIKLFDWDSVSAYKIAHAQEGYVFRYSRVRPYFVRFSIDNVVTQLDNNLLMTRYQPFDPSAPNFFLNPMSFLLKFGITDLLENHKLYGGLRLPFVGIDNNSEYFITYENLTRRLDKRFTFYRRNQSGRAYNRLPFGNTPLPPDYYVEYNVKTNYAEAEFRYPLDVLQRLSLGLAFRHDLIVYKSRDEFTLNLPRLSNNWLFVRGEYVFDNCMEVMTNIRYGTRFKVFLEGHKEFPTENKTLFDQVDFPVPQFNKVFMGVFGLDLRHYLKVYRQIIWANRLAAGASFGPAKLIYYLGGLDNWISGPAFEKFDRNTPINTRNRYVFQTLATPLRGFRQNARNGDKYVAINSELRIPLFTALSQKPIRSDFIRNLQLIAFADAGTAWEGLSPFSDKNPLFNETIPNETNNPSVIVKVKRYKTPVVLGFGTGVRTTFLGYFIRYDAGWGYDTGEITPRPIHYLTIGLDF
ncbi:MAG: hypothetical protein NZM35_09710 [Chitinophagales bacterium]|nr:hypothetical protein [Chitinophagales bacterium]MDW8419538.1 WD40 repeat domain-containing protein [Chitinophagales bacterium]